MPLLPCPCGRSTPDDPTEVRVFDDQGAEIITKCAVCFANVQPGGVCVCGPCGTWLCGDSHFNCCATLSQLCDERALIKAELSSTPPGEWMVKVFTPRSVTIIGDRVEEPERALLFLRQLLAFALLFEFEMFVEMWEVLDTWAPTEEIASNARNELFVGICSRDCAGVNYSSAATFDRWIATTGVDDNKDATARTGNDNDKDNDTADSDRSKRVRTRRGKMIALMLRDPRIDPAWNDNFAVSIAAETGSFEIVEMLLADSRVDPSNQGNEALRWAAQNGHVTTVERLLKHDKVDPSARNSDALRCAARYGRVQVVDLLLKDGRSKPGVLHNSALRTAVNYNRLEVVKLLLTDKRVDPGASSSASIRVAARRGFTEIVKVLLQSPRTKPAARQNEAIAHAARQGHREVVELLLGDPRVKLVGNQAVAVLSSTAMNGHAHVVELLLADPNVDRSASRNQALSEAARGGHMVVVEFLLKDKKTDPSADNNSAARNAAGNNHREVTELLLRDSRVMTKYLFELPVPEPVLRVGRQVFKVDKCAAMSAFLLCMRARFAVCRLSDVLRLAADDYIGVSIAKS